MESGDVRRAGLRRGAAQARHRAAGTAPDAPRSGWRRLRDRGRAGARTPGVHACARRRPFAGRCARGQGARGVAANARRTRRTCGGRCRLAAQRDPHRHARRRPPAVRGLEVAAAPRRFRCDRQARAHTAHHAGRKLRLHDGLRPRDDARADRPHGPILHARMMRLATLAALMVLAVCAHAASPDGEHARTPKWREGLPVGKWATVPGTDKLRSLLKDDGWAANIDASCGIGLDEQGNAYWLKPGGHATVPFGGWRNIDIEIRLATDTPTVELLT